ncbi:MAG: biosynthetic peptidoglycan transglycosylase, partial [Cyanobacteria bacterium J06623_4]
MVASKTKHPPDWVTGKSELSMTVRPSGESTEVANLFSQLKQWSNRLTGSSKQTSRSLHRTGQPSRQLPRTGRPTRTGNPKASGPRVGIPSSNGNGRGATGRNGNGKTIASRNGISSNLSPANRTNNIRPGGAALPATPQAQTRHFSPRRPAYTRIWFWLLLLVGAGIAGPSARIYLLWSNLQETVPDVTKALTFERSGTITLKAGDGKILQKVGPTAQESLAFDEIPDVVVQAFIASEDRRFYEHNGVDYRSIARATVANVTSGGVVEGASTITQQLARITFLNLDQSFQRKIREAFLAQRLEKELGKEKVLERYLNLVYLGAGAYGVADAAWIYFGKTVDKLSVADVALIAGMAPAPSVYSPLV